MILPALTCLILGVPAVLTLYRKVRPLFSVKVNCWFCGITTVVPYGNINCWDCPTCEQYNGFKEDRFDSEVEEYQKRLEEVYALCGACAQRLRHRLSEQDSLLRPQLFGQPWYRPPWQWTSRRTVGFKERVRLLLSVLSSVLGLLVSFSLLLVLLDSWSLLGGPGGRWNLAPLLGGRPPSPLVLRLTGMTLAAGSVLLAGPRRFGTLEVALCWFWLLVLLFGLPWTARAMEHRQLLWLGAALAGVTTALGAARTTALLLLHRRRWREGQLVVRQADPSFPHSWRHACALRNLQRQRVTTEPFGVPEGFGTLEVALCWFWLLVLLFGLPWTARAMEHRQLLWLGAALAGVTTALGAARTTALLLLHRRRWREGQLVVRQADPSFPHSWRHACALRNFQEAGQLPWNKSVIESKWGKWSEPEQWLPHVLQARLGNAEQPPSVHAGTRVPEQGRASLCAKRQLRVGAGTAVAVAPWLPAESPVIAAGVIQISSGGWKLLRKYGRRCKSFAERQGPAFDGRIRVLVGSEADVRHADATAFAHGVYGKGLCHLDFSLAPPSAIASQRSAWLGGHSPSNAEGDRGTCFVRQRANGSPPDEDDYEKRSFIGSSVSQATRWGLEKSTAAGYCQTPAKERVTCSRLLLVLSVGANVLLFAYFVALPGVGIGAQ
ncbi:hypothetical protein HPB47_004589 [Ixodes persulcatus]|uniref:Uncharacterized protein n=1 Tax=Ixodes persulcatus TaxID=34615 RepID=A0AC60PFK8_IXOPE|nr:hypothetical protein HPB47_004589 [Ixodes persulcatus]